MAELIHRFASELLRDGKVISRFERDLLPGQSFESHEHEFTVTVQPAGVSVDLVERVEVHPPLPIPVLPSQVDELVRAAREMVDTITEARDGFRRIKQGDEIAHVREEAAFHHEALNALLRRYRARVAPFPDPEPEGEADA